MKAQSELTGDRKRWAETTHPRIPCGVTIWFLMNKSLPERTDKNRAEDILCIDGIGDLCCQTQEIIENEKRQYKHNKCNLACSHMPTETRDIIGDYFCTDNGRLLNARTEGLCYDIEGILNDAERYIRTEFDTSRVFDQMLTAVHNTIEHYFTNDNEVRIALLFSNEQFALRKFGENLLTGCLDVK